MTGSPLVCEKGDRTQVYEIPTGSEMEAHIEWECYGPTWEPFGEGWQRGSCPIGEWNEGQVMLRDLRMITDYEATNVLTIVTHHPQDAHGGLRTTTDRYEFVQRPWADEAHADEVWGACHLDQGWVEVSA